MTYCRITIREAGLFVFAEVFDLGLVLQWDRGTRVYVRADPKWKDRVSDLMTDNTLCFQLIIWFSDLQLHFLGCTPS